MCSQVELDAPQMHSAALLELLKALALLRKRSVPLLPSTLRVLAMRVSSVSHHLRLHEAFVALSCMQQLLPEGPRSLREPSGVAGVPPQNAQVPAEELAAMSHTVIESLGQQLAANHAKSGSWSTVGFSTVTCGNMTRP